MIILPYTHVFFTRKVELAQSLQFERMFGNGICPTSPTRCQKCGGAEEKSWRGSFAMKWTVIMQDTLDLGLRE